MVTAATFYCVCSQKLLIFPLLAVISSIGLWHILRQIMPYQGWKYVAMGIIALLIIKPAYDNIKNYPYQYIYFNEFQGGISGAYGNFELDYYFTSFKDAYNWIDENKDGATKIVAANFIIPEYYKNKPYASQLIDYYNRSVQDWDYAVICNTFLHPYQLKEGIWPPENSVYEVTVAGKPILAVLKRRSKQNLEGIGQLQSGNYDEALAILSTAGMLDPQNESVLVNLARAYILNEEYEMAKGALKKLLDVYPDNEWGLDLLGEMLMHTGVFEEAIILFQKNIGNNHKFFHSYVNLAKAYLLIGAEEKAVDTLMDCLRINPFYEPAYEVYGHLLIDRGEIELGEKMLNFQVEGSSKYGMPQ
jgi:tetratricopeptide (TPR) repeat protein